MRLGVHCEEKRVFKPLSNIGSILRWAKAQLELSFNLNMGAIDGLDRAEGLRLAVTP